MKQILAARLADRSNREAFCFSLTCTECGGEWKSVPVRFSKAGQVPSTPAQQALADALYLREHAQAKDRALNEAAQHFNHCPLCRGLICNYCFVICDDLDMCRSCADTLEQNGEAVMELPLTAACSPG